MYREVIYIKRDLDTFLIPAGKHFLFGLPGLIKNTIIDRLRNLM